MADRVNLLSCAVNKKLISVKIGENNPVREYQQMLLCYGLTLLTF